MGYSFLKKWGKYGVSSFILGYAAIHVSWAATCSEAEALKTWQDKGDYRSALQELDNCLSAQQSFSNQDIDLFNQLLKQVLAPNTATSLEESYRNFQSVLKTHLLGTLGFEFADYFKTNPKEDSKLFAEIRQPDEKYYFYYDTGRVVSHSRGIALTDKALFWKNLTGEPQRLGFDDINHMTLVYELGLSLTGWEIRVNQDEANDIRLSGVPDNVIQPLVSAIIYFINANKTTPAKEMIRLEVADREIAILAGWVTLCRDKYTSQADPLKDLQTLDTCLVNYGKDFKLSQTDNELVHQLTGQILSQTNLDLEAGYSHFQAILATHFFSDLKLNFKDNFDPQRQAELFKEANTAGDPYYFYFDTGKVAADSRGIALTNKAIIWKNLLGSSVSWENITGSANQLSFEKITHISLIHEIGLASISGWKLRLNEDEKNDIVLSQLSADNVELFAATLVYFINVATHTQLALQIPSATQEVLTKTFLERHPQIKSVTDSVFGLFMPKSIDEKAAPSTEDSATVPATENSTTEATPTVDKDSEPVQDSAKEATVSPSPASEPAEPSTPEDSVTQETSPADTET
ncbi:MAG: hypothetical protein HC877_22600, partial [Thioploca sp.]|nr:hypothetical protein [Thioploca sp.]